MTALQGGGFVVAWEDHSAAGAAGQTDSFAQIDVRAQFFDAAGARVGSEILVNTTTAGRQSAHKIITLADGSVVIAWTDSGSGASDVRAQRLDAAGNKTGGEFLLNTSTAGSQFTPVLQALAGGGFVAAWLSNTGTAGSVAQVFANDGTKIGGEIEVPSGNSGIQSIVALADGGFVLGWDQVPNNASNRDSFLQVFTASGIPVGGSTVLHQTTQGNQQMGDFAIGADGRLLTVWMDGASLSGGSPPGNGLDLRARLFDSLTIVTGDDSGEVLTGTAGPDLIYGQGGGDTLSGLAGNDFLIGGAGDDNMNGGAGNDTYYVDAPGDVVIEAAGGGNDRVAASASYQLAAGAEVETLEAITLTDTTPLNLAGNEIANRIIGNAGSNILDGGAGDDRLEGGAGDDYLVGGLGADQMFGNAGNDTYYVDNAGDRVFEAGGEGVDRVAAIVSFQLAAGADIQLLEAVTLTATTPLELIGNEIGQTVVGNAGANLIDGGGGRDELVGAGGADTFRFATALGSGNVDRIHDFQAGTDKIALDDAIFSALTPGTLPAGAFVIGAQALDADDRIIYDQSSGRLFYDSDGNGTAVAVEFASLLGAPSIAASDFLVI